jgi:hypothetical protein
VETLSRAHRAPVWIAALDLVASAAANAAAVGSAQAAVQTRTVEYQHGEVTLEGAYVWDDSTDAKRPGVVAFHKDLFRERLAK